MAIPQSASILHHLRQTVLRRDGAGLSDGQLLRSFLHHRDEAAFEALVRRHGPMVRGVCRRVLRDSHDADDAFQAAFLVLMQKASTLAMREVVGDWLHGVAYRTALKARVAAARRRLKERQKSRSEAILDEEAQAEWRPLLDQEIGCLPEKYRTPLVLCDLEGRTRKEAAQQLGWPEGTLSGRLSRARAMLGRRLTRRGITLSAGALAVGLASEASARLPFSLVGSTCKAAMGFAAGSAAGFVPGRVIALTEGVVKAMLFSKVKKVLALVAILVLTAGVGGWHYAAVSGQTEDRSQARPTSVAPAVNTTLTPKVTSGPIPRARRAFQINLTIAEKKDGQRKLLAEPRLITLEGKPATFAVGDYRTIQLGSGMTEEALKGVTVRVVIRSDQGGKIRLDLTVCRPTEDPAALGVATPPPGDHEEVELMETRTLRLLRAMTLGKPVWFEMNYKGSSVLGISAKVHEVKQEVNPNTVTAAEKDLKIAESHRQAGRRDSARLQYELIRRRYPDTLYAERAKERLAELKKQKEKPPARVGQIFIIGNEKTGHNVILKQVPLFPGQILTLPDDLQIAEKNLARLKGLKSKPTVTVIDREGDGVFKDIRITVEEK